MASRTAEIIQPAVHVPAGGGGMKPLEKWLADNGYPKATFWYHRKHNPENVPDTIKIGRRHYVTDQQDAEFKARKVAEARVATSTGGNGR